MIKFLGLLLLLVPTTLYASDDIKPDRVTAIYFHRTDPCPTCKRMSSYSETAVTTFKTDKCIIQWLYVDFEANPREAAKYNVTRPSLILVSTLGSRLLDYENLTEIWVKGRDKAAFIKYVQDSIRKKIE
jgi:hypothetical protein